MNKELREYFNELDDEYILWDGFDDAIIGLGERCEMSVVAYDKDKIIHIMVERDGCSTDEALEYYDFNILNSYVGERTPIVIERIDNNY